MCLTLYISRAILVYSQKLNRMSCLKNKNNKANSLSFSQTFFRMFCLLCLWKTKFRLNFRADQSLRITFKPIIFRWRNWDLQISGIAQSKRQMTVSWIPYTKKEAKHLEGLLEATYSKPGNINPTHIQGDTKVCQLWVRHTDCIVV